MPASRFHDGQSGALYHVRTQVFGRELRIADAAGITLRSWKLEDVRVAPERDPDGAVALTARGQSGVLLVDDPAEIESLRAAGVRPPTRKAWSRGLWYAVGAGMAAIVTIGVLTVTVLPRWLTAIIPVAWEQRIGGPEESLITSNIARCRGEAGQAALQRFVERLRAAGGIETPIAISVLNDKTVNAFTLPGGHVLVLRGLIDRATDGPMLAGVIAHELGHVEHRDTMTLMLRSLGVSLLLSTIGYGDPGTIAASASNLMNLAYSRSAEAAADAAAIDLLTKAGLRADGLSRFFVMLEQRESGGAAGGDETPERGSDHHFGTGPSWLATHPPTESRRRLTARPDSGEEPFTADEWNDIKTICAR